MLGKLLKYELRATGRTFWPLFLGILLFGLINRYFYMGYTNAPGLTGEIIQNISIFLYGALIMSSFVAILIVVIQRFYRNLLGTEGYLMFTLPVKPWQLVFSKVIATFIWYIVASVVLVISLIFIFGELYMIDDIIYFFQYVFPEAAYELRMEFGIPWGLWVAEISVAGIISLVSSLLLLYAAISMGHLTVKAKKLSAFAWFLALNALTGIVTTVVYAISGLSSNFYSFFIYLLDSYQLLVEPMSFAALFHYNVLASTLISAAFAVFSYFLIRWVFAKKLNIE